MSTETDAKLQRILSPFDSEERRRLIQAMDFSRFGFVGNDLLTSSGENSGFVLVASKNDLPEPVGNVITLRDQYTYYFTKVVDLEGCRLVCNQNTTILGSSSENCRIKSTGLTGEALITSAWSLPMRFITIEADIALDLDATGNPDQALDWIGVNFTDCGAVGTIRNYPNFIMGDGAFINSQGLTFDGESDTIGFFQCLFECSPGGTLITLPDTLTINRRFRIIYSAFVVLSGETGIDASETATVPVEGYILDTVNFSGGGTYTTGIEYTDTKALFVNNRGINNSARISYYFMTGNATATTIGSATVPTKVLGTTTEGAITQKFVHTNNRATYTGALPRTFSVSATATSGSTNNNVISFYIARNGTAITASKASTTVNANGRGENSKCQAIVTLNTDDFIEVFVANDSTTANVTVFDLNVIVQEIP